jgi:hypothetical protein
MAVVLSNGKSIELREPMASDLRGVKLLDVLQLDAGACAPVIERVSDMPAAEFYTLKAVDALAIMTELVGFLAPSASQPA